MTQAPLSKHLKHYGMESSEFGFCNRKSQSNVAPTANSQELSDAQLTKFVDFLCTSKAGTILLQLIAEQCIVFSEQLKSIRVDLEESASHNFELDKVALEMYTLLWHGLAMLVETRKASGSATKCVKVCLICSLEFSSTQRIILLSQERRMLETRSRQCDTVSSARLRTPSIWN